MLMQPIPSVGNLNYLLFDPDQPFSYDDHDKKKVHHVRRVVYFVYNIVGANLVSDICESHDYISYIYVLR